MAADLCPLFLMNIRTACFAGLSLVISSAYVLAAPPVAGIVVRGDLVADLRPDLTADNTQWVNHATGEKTVGNLSRPDKAKLPVTSIAGPTGKAELKTVQFNGDMAGTLLSSKNVPMEITGSNSVSVEAWIKTPGTLADHATVIGYGVRPGDGKQRQFLYGKAKPFSGYFADVEAWGSFTPDADAWHYLAWIYDGDSKSMYVYVDGKEVTRGTPTLDTAVSLLAVGAGPTEDNSGSFTTDPLIGYMACLRVETGVLSADDIQKNYTAGVSAIPTKK